MRIPRTYCSKIYLLILPRPRPRPRPLPAPLPVELLFTTCFCLGVSSTNKASTFNDSGNNHARIVEPRTLSVEYETGFLPRLWIEQGRMRTIYNHQIKISTTRYIHCHFCLFEMTIHRGIDTNNSALNDGTILEFNRYLFSV